MVNLIFQLLEIDYISKEVSDSGLLFFFRFGQTVGH